MTDSQRDLRCLERLQRGESKALQELFDRYAPLLYPMVLRIVREASVAEDVVQDVWLQIWKRVATFDAARGTVGAWLVTLARGRALERQRELASRRGAGRRSEPGSPPAPPDDAAIPAAQRRLHEQVASAFAQLTPQQRQAIELGYFEGLPETEIAARLGAPPGTVKSWTRQGLARLRELVPEEQRV